MLDLFEEANPKWRQKLRTQKSKWLTVADRQISENELLKKENACLQSERDILKKVSSGVLVVVYAAKSTDFNTNKSILDIRAEIKRVWKCNWASKHICQK